MSKHSSLVALVALACMEGSQRVVAWLMAAVAEPGTGQPQKTLESSSGPEPARAAASLASRAFPALGPQLCFQPGPAPRAAQPASPQGVTSRF